MSVRIKLMPSTLKDRLEPMAKDDAQALMKRTPTCLALGCRGDATCVRPCQQESMRKHLMVHAHPAM